MIEQIQSPKSILLNTSLFLGFALGLQNLYLNQLYTAPSSSNNLEIKAKSASTQPLKKTIEQVELKTSSIATSKRKASKKTVTNLRNKPQPINKQIVKLKKAKVLAIAPPSPQNQILDPEVSQKFSKAQVLNDLDQRISKDFKIHKRLKKRVGFWFDIYTKHDSDKYVLHHTKFPWLVYKVIDIKPFYNGKGPTWLKKSRGEKLVKKEKKKLKNRLLALSKRKNFRNLNAYDRHLYKLIKGIRGPIRKNLKIAAYKFRTQVGQKNFIQTGILKSIPFLPMMEREFENYGLPTELTRIPFVESSFNVDAFSRVGASGIWQIIPRSGKEFLILNKHIDERNSPLKATQFARKHLRRDYRILRSWPLAITAYNHGVGGVRKGVKKLKSKSIIKLISYYSSPSFKFASRNFYTCFLAVLHAEKYKEQYFNVPNDTTTLNLQSITVNKKSRVKNIAKNLKLNLKTLVKHNLDLKKAIKANVHLPKGFELFIPTTEKQL
ncbi:MAG: lytic transglycosylase domain-containing protein [Bdellovibrionaceae bacterium]|jgi:membrane-bound lytic murein transglycosylase D|nr:lytic transglycosylase domain-containing protein [Pseudobdellovibrionaceae bacterium]